MKYLFNSIKELREFVKNDFESSYKIELVEKNDKIIVKLDDKQIATIPYNTCSYNDQSMYVIDPKEIKSLNFIFDRSITFEEIASNENTKEINVMTSSANVKCITFNYRDKYDIEIKSFGMYEITINSTISTKANHFTNIFKSIDKEIETIK